MAGIEYDALMLVGIVGAKGGQGRSTIAARLGAWLAIAGHRTLLVDLSPVGTASSLCGFGGSPDPGAGALLDGDVAASEVVRETDCPGLSLLRADSQLTGARHGPGAARRLRAAGRGWDFVLLDPASGTGGLAETAMSAADWVLVPVIADDAGLAGLGSTMAWLKDTRPSLRRRPRLAGIVVNAHEPRTAAGRDCCCRPLPCRSWCSRACGSLRSG